MHEELQMSYVATIGAWLLVVAAVARARLGAERVRLLGRSKWIAVAAAFVVGICVGVVVGASSGLLATGFALAVVRFFAAGERSRVASTLK
jgi:hypothetical protein